MRRGRGGRVRFIIRRRFLPSVDSYGGWGRGVRGVASSFFYLLDYDVREIYVREILSFGMGFYFIKQYIFILSHSHGEPQNRLYFRRTF